MRNENWKNENLSQERCIKLVQDVPTRWNSTYDMLDSVIVNKRALEVMVDDDETSAIGSKMPSEHEFILLEGLCQILRPLKDLTVYLSASTYSTCNLLYRALI